LWDEDKEERRKSVRKKERKKEKNELYFINYVFKIILIKSLLGNWI
jgi:hypothetical protein